MVIFTARQNLANLNEVKMNLIVKFANLAGKSYIIAKTSLVAGAIIIIIIMYNSYIAHITSTCIYFSLYALFFIFLITTKKICF